MFLKINDDKYTYAINTDKIIYFSLTGINNNFISIEMDSDTSLDLWFENSNNAISTIRKLSELLETRNVN